MKNIITKTKNNPKLRRLLIAVGVIVLLGIVLLLLRGDEDTWIKDKNGNWVKHGNPAIQDFAGCAKTYPVILTYPEQCSIPDGPTFTNND